MLEQKVEKLQSLLTTDKQKKLLKSIQNEIEMRRLTAAKYATAFSHCWDGMDAPKAAEEVGLTKKGNWV